MLEKGDDLETSGSGSATREPESRGRQSEDDPVISKPLLKELIT